MVANQGRKRAKAKRKTDRRKEKENVRIFGVVSIDKNGNPKISHK